MNYDRTVEQIRKTVVELNEIHGYPEGVDPSGRVQGFSFGYLGNDGDIHHSVFMPHPGRPALSPTGSAILRTATSTAPVHASRRSAAPFSWRAGSAERVTSPVDITDPTKAPTGHGRGFLASA